MFSSSPDTDQLLDLAQSGDAGAREQKAANEPKLHCPGFCGVSDTEVKTDCVEDAPQTDVIFMTSLDKTLQNVIRRHAKLLSVHELDFLDGDWPASRVDGIDIN